MGKGHYRTRVKVNKDKFYTLVFDGAMSHADVFVNGEEMVYWPYGYNTFDCYILPHLITSDSVDIDVFLENKPQQSRWYPGAGLYRNVHLVESDPIHIPTFGILIRTPQIKADRARVEIAVELQNGVEETTCEQAGVRIQTDFFYDGQYVGTAEGANGSCNILRPHLWSPEAPHLYVAKTQVLRGDEVLDEKETRFGIHTISYTAEKGFQLNGETRKFKGVCLHHDQYPQAPLAYHHVACRRRHQHVSACGRGLHPHEG